MSSYCFWNPFFFLRTLKMSLNFFLCSLSLFSYHNEKQKNSDNPFRFSGCVFQFKCRHFFLPNLPAFQVFIICNVVQSLFNMGNWKNPPVAIAVSRQTPGASGITQPVQDPAGHLLGTNAGGLLTPSASVSALVFGSNNTSLMEVL